MYIYYIKLIHAHTYIYYIYIYMKLMKKRSWIWKRAGKYILESFEGEKGREKGCFYNLKNKRKIEVAKVTQWKINLTDI